MIRVLLFDLGGVVFTDLFSGGEKEFAAALDLPIERVLEAYAKTDLVAYDEDETADWERWGLFVNELGLPWTDIPRCIEAYHKSYQPISETVALLRQIHDEGRYRLGVLSDQPMSEDEQLHGGYMDIFQLFDPALTIVSAEVGLSKKDADGAIYKLAAERAQADPDNLLFIDDSAHNIAAAQAAGLQTFFFDIARVSVTELLAGLQEKIGVTCTR